MLAKLTEKLGDTDKAKTVAHDKRLSEKRSQNIDRILDRFVYLCNDYCTKMEALIDRAKAMGITKEDTAKTTPRGK
jgi:hypothetical protein